VAVVAGASRLADLPPTRHDPEHVRRAADEILSRPEYRWDEPASNPLEGIAEWIADRLAGITSSFGVGGASLPVWVGYAVLGLLVALVAFIVWRSRAGLRRRAVPGHAEPRVVVAPGEERLDWAAEAERHEAAGRWRDGLRCRYRVLVGELARRELIPDLVGRTAGELVADVRASCPPAASAFTAATTLFEAAWYGGAVTGAGERDRFARLAADVLAVARPGPGGAGPAGGRALVAPS
jgi:hypothetical protein